MLYMGYYRDIEVDITINEVDIFNGYKAIKCLECEGTGIWDYVDYIPIEDCICCKGTGIILINV